MKKILFIENGEKIGGANKSLITINKVLMREGIETLVLVSKTGMYTKELNKNNINYKVQETQLAKFSKPIILFNMIKAFIIILKFSPQIIHANDINCYKFYGRIARFLKIPIICHMRHFASKQAATYMLDTHPNYILYNSQYNLEKTTTEIKGTSLTSIPHKVAYNFFNIEEYYNPDLRDEFRKKLAIPNDYTAITIIGNINPLKGHLIFIESIHKLLSTHPILSNKIIVNIVGEDITNSGIKEQCKSLITKYQLNSRVNFQGFISDTAGVYAASDIIVIPSEEEPFGRVAVEAILAKKQVVASNSSGLGEILLPLKTPRLCQHSSSEELYLALLDAITNPSSTEDLTNDQAFISTLFSEMTQLQELTDVYNELLNE